MRTNFHLNTTVVAIFPNFCLWRRSLCSDSVLTLKNRIEPPSYARTAYVVAIWPSFLFDSFVKIWATCEIFLGKWFTAPPGKKFPVRLWRIPLDQEWNSWLPVFVENLRHSMIEERGHLVESSNFSAQERKLFSYNCFLFTFQNELRPRDVRIIIKLWLWHSTSRSDTRRGMKLKESHSKNSSNTRYKVQTVVSPLTL